MKKEEKEAPVRSGNMWKKAKVRMTFTGRLCGSVPLKKEIVDGWLKARMPKEPPEEGKTLEEIKQEVMDTIEEIQEKVTLGFQHNDKGLVVRGGTIKAHMKDCANQVKGVLKEKLGTFRAMVANKIYIDEYFVNLKKDGEFIKESTGVYDQPVHVFIPGVGPRNALKTIQYIEGAELEFHIRMMDDNELKEEQILYIFEYGSIHGYGGERSLGEGRYTFEIVWE